MFITIGRVCIFALHNMVRNIWLSTVTISLITLSLLSVNFFLLAGVFSDTAISSIESRANLTIYFKPAASDADVRSLHERLRTMPEVRTIDTISKEEALTTLKEKYEKEKNALIQESLSELGENPLTASIVVRAHTIEGYAALQKVLEESQYLGFIERRDFEDRTMLIKRIKDLKEQIIAVGTTVNIFFAFVAALIVYNTIRITIYTRQREIGIMKLVGATNWFIRAPMIIESMLYSILAIGCTVVIVYPLLGFIQPYVNRFFDGSGFDVLGYFSSNFASIFGLQLLASLALNMTSSAFAIGRYLKV